MVSIYHERQYLTPKRLKNGGGWQELSGSSSQRQKGLRQWCRFHRVAWWVLENSRVWRATCRLPSTALIILEYGAKKDRYWSSECFINNIYDALKVTGFKYPLRRNTLVFIFDQSSCHKTYAEALWPFLSPNCHLRVNMYAEQCNLWMSSILYGILQLRMKPSPRGTSPCPWELRTSSGDSMCAWKAGRAMWLMKR